MRNVARIILFLISAVFFLWIFNENVPIAGIKNILYTFGTPSGSVTQLRPMARLAESGKEGAISYQKIIEDPVYFDLRTPIAYDTIVVEMLYKNLSSRTVGLGIKQYPTQTEFFITPFVPLSEQGGWTVARAEISLKNIQRMPGKYSLSLSFPGLAYHPNINEYVLVSRAQIVLQRKPLTLEDIRRYMYTFFTKK